MPLPSEAVRGQHVDVGVVVDALPRFEWRAAIAFACAISPYLLVVGSRFWQAPEWTAIVVIGSLVGPSVGAVLGGVTARRLAAIPADDRPRGLIMANAARIVGLFSVVLWAVMFVSIFALCAAFTNGFQPA